MCTYTLRTTRTAVCSRQYNYKPVDFAVKTNGLPPERIELDIWKASASDPLGQHVRALGTCMIFFISDASIMS